VEIEPIAFIAVLFVQLDIPSISKMLVEALSKRKVSHVFALDLYIPHWLIKTSTLLLLAVGVMVAVSPVSK